MLKLDDKITVLKGVGEKRSQQYAKLGVNTVHDLLYHFPRSYIDYSEPVPIAETVLNENNVISGIITVKKAPAHIRKGLVIYKAIITDDSGDATITIYNSDYMFDKLSRGGEYVFYGKVTGDFLKREITSPMILSAKIEDKIQPIYPLTEGLTQPMMRLTMKNALTVLNSDIYEPVPKKHLTENSLASLSYALENIHFPKDMNELILAKDRLIFDELLILQLGMSMIKGRAKIETGCSMKAVSLQDFNKILPFEMTNAQQNAISDCLGDMQKPNAMNRLIQGDVGSGKTVIAAACAYFAYKNGFQTALMVPTEILANQHYNTLSQFLEPLGVKVCLLTGSLTAKEKASVKAELVDGEYTVAVGTHALIQSTTIFKNLGLVVTDEQHRFGVEQRALLSGKGLNPHRLVMSATPIPRTLALMIYGDLDISVVNELPKGRKKIETYAVTGKLRERAFGFVKDRLREGRQAYIVCSMIEDNDMDLQAVESYSKQISENQFKEFQVGLLHGKMQASDKEEIMLKFKNHEIDLLVSTTVVEVGVDVPNAVVMLIENADRFGLSQMHQLRGRVGRGKHQSYCILVTDNVTEESRKRLKILSSTSDGFKISEEDLKLRGPGDFFGQRQHGLPKLKIADMAVNMDALSIAQKTAAKILDYDYD
ncbi:MAG: ATP-dependent DNA helicase RecG, partial [Clostridiales bacterium]|nr:ATP-dependent DNA helicase RecG [Clostridiales bacterium]